jgi:alkylation response protein AidB-like acyl-CoA dehydrogenase
MGQFAVIASEQLFQHDYAMHDGALRAARAYVLEAFGEAETVAVSGSVPSLVQQQRLRQATTYATRVAADAARFAYLWAGTGALRSGSVVQRCFRDIHAATQHIYVDNNTLSAYTQALAAQR